MKFRNNKYLWIGISTIIFTLGIYFNFFYIDESEPEKILNGKVIDLEKFSASSGLFVTSHNISGWKATISITNLNNNDEVINISVTKKFHHEKLFIGKILKIGCSKSWFGLLKDYSIVEDNFYLE